jgi:putative transposase
MIDHRFNKLSIRRQCQLLGVNRGMLYYRPQPVSAETLDIMDRIDRQYTKTPFYGVERMTAQLKRDGLIIGHNRVRQLMRLMGLMPIYPKPKLSGVHPDRLCRNYDFANSALDFWRKISVLWPIFAL